MQEVSLQIFQRFLSEAASRVVKFKYRFPISVNFDEVMNIECKIEEWHVIHKNVAQTLTQIVTWTRECASKIVYK